MGSIEATHFISRTQAISWRRGSLWTTTTSATSCSIWFRHEQLITALALGLHWGTPKINTFSGDITPGKTEVSFEQWNHEIQCIKDHYPESMVQESIMRSLKGAAVDMAQYMGPTAGVSDIWDKLTVIFGTVASFDVLMQNFYKITQGNNKKVPTSLEGTLT